MRVRKGLEEEGLFKLSFEEQAEFGHVEIRERSVSNLSG